jgi:uncharacterized protein YacL
MQSKLALRCISWGWSTMILGIVTGSLLGMFAFDGPFPAPAGMEDYSSLVRRMLRLAHIAFVALPLITIVYGGHIDGAQLPERWKKMGVYSMVFGMIGVPVFLILASLVWLPFKYFEVAPVTGVLAALCIMARGYWSYGFKK